MQYYCTLFDSFYLSRGLAMYESLKRHAPDFHLYIFAFDDLSEKILVSLKLESVTVITLKDFETSELLEVKKSRTIAEYCWTCTPSTISYVIEKYSVPECTYIDSDLIFYSDPAILTDEMNEHNKTVLITEHHFSALPKLHEFKRAGRFCVQFVTFRNEEKSLRVLDCWRLQCIEWCYSRYEDGKFGDQKYLDEWPVRYNNVHILGNRGGGIAPWNIGQYIFYEESGFIESVIHWKSVRFKVVFYHFQYVKFLENGLVDLGWYFLPMRIIKLFYFPYLFKISEIEKKLITTYPGYKTGLTHFKADNVRSFLKIGFKKMLGYNIFKLSKLNL
jgi:hypothetical protein